MRAATGRGDVGADPDTSTWHWQLGSGLRTDRALQAKRDAERYASTCRAGALRPGRWNALRSAEGGASAGPAC